MTDQIGVIGAGAWGTTHAVRLAAGQRPITLWAHSAEAGERLAQERENRRYLPGIVFPPNVRVATDAAYLEEPHRLFVLAVPSEHLRGTLRRVGPHLHPGTALLTVVKGIEVDTRLRMSEVVMQELAGRRIAVLSGPNLAREIAAGKPAGSVVASADADLAAEVAQLLSSDRFRVYTNPDVVGVELAGALKNIVALAAGMVDGLGFGDSAKAGIITRGLAEITRLGLAAGAHPMTFAGLAGIGDLIATCMSPLSRNHSFGVRLGQGMAVDEVVAVTKQTAEGVKSCTSLLDLARQRGVDVPIIEQVDAMITEGKSAQDVVGALLSRPRKAETG